MIFRNAFFENGQVTWFDQEWALDNVPARYILYRALHETYCAFEDIESTLPLGEITVRYNLSDEWNDYRKFEEIFEASVADMKYIQERNAFCGVDQKICVSNISKILQS